MTKKIKQLRVKFGPGSTVIRAEAKSGRGTKFAVGKIEVNRDGESLEEYRGRRRIAIARLLAS